MKTPKHLGRQSSRPIEELDTIAWDQGPITVTLDATEFTSHCPVTGQPDFGQLLIEYVPNRHLVETKSFKLFLWQFRDLKAFNEAIVARIHRDFWEQVRPVYLRVTGTFNRRGGIGVSATVEKGEPL
jgi:7-cyano-7-deazaguanine reductase